MNSLASVLFSLTASIGFAFYVIGKDERFINVALFFMLESILFALYDLRSRAQRKQSRSKK